jgi:hypothetical protein
LVLEALEKALVLMEMVQQDQTLSFQSSRRLAVDLEAGLMLVMVDQVDQAVERLLVMLLITQAV